MWEYLNKKIRPRRPQPGSTDVHRPHSIDPQAQSGQVDVHGDDDSQDKAKQLFAELGSAGRRRADSGASTEGTAAARAGTRRRLNCPVCQTEMQLERVGRVELDRCPECRGIFLDRGELEQLSGRDPSSYVIPDPESDDRDRHFLIYTPHGLSDHVRDA